MVARKTMLTVPPSAGEVLRELLLSDGRITQDQLADAMGVSRYSINQLVNDRRAVTAEMALRLAKATSTTAEFWLDLQRNVDLAKARRKLGSKLDAIPPVRKPLSEAEMFYHAD